MADISAFHGIRYQLGSVGSLSDVIAPPYDVIDDAFRDQLYKQHPANVVRLILNRREPGDDDGDSDPRYARAASFLKRWLNEGVLEVESQAAVYVYHQEFTHDGTKFTRRGFMSRVRLEPFGTGKIFPHEETMPGPKKDRLALMTACRANLSQVFGLYPDPQSDAQEILERAKQGITPVEATDHLGVVHRLWPVSDPAVISELSAAMGPKAMFIADGHHRYETACNYREQVLGNGSSDTSHPANHVLMMCVGMSDPGMIVLPTHRLFRGAPELSSDELVAALGDKFTTRIAGEGSDLAATIWQEVETKDDQGTVGLYAAKDDRWVVATITEAGRARLAELAPDRSDDWRGLGVSILHRLIVEDLLDGGDWPTPKYVHLVDEVVEGLDSGEFPLAAVVMPATLEHIRVISEHGERMPPKSTYFYPKLLSGLVIHSLE